MPRMVYGNQTTGPAPRQPEHAPTPDQPFSRVPLCGSKARYPLIWPGGTDLVTCLKCRNLLGFAARKGG